MDSGLREAVRQRAGEVCEYCLARQEFSGLRFHIEHIIPRQHSGTSTLENLALACPACNLRKGPNLTGIDPLSAETVRLFHPRLDRWATHFMYQGVRIVGRTAVGRTTAHLLGMNDSERLRKRHLLLTIGRLSGPL